jgi:hypothetical protein
MNLKMKKYLVIGFIIFGFSCQNSQTEKKVSEIPNKNPEITEKPKVEPKKPDQENIVGQEFFDLILDTISIKPISKELLLDYEWEYKPFDNCKSILTFNPSGNVASIIGYKSPYYGSKYIPRLDLITMAQSLAQFKPN